MDLIRAFEEGKVAGVESTQAIVDSQISRIFLGKSRAYKVYRKSAAFFGNLGDWEYRKSFYLEDFEWNAEMCPQIYTALVSVAWKDGCFVTVPYEEAEDFYIDMVRVDADKTLTKQLLAGAVTQEQLKDLVAQLQKHTDELKGKKFDELLNEDDSWLFRQSQRLQDIREFATHQSTFPEDVMANALSLLEKHIQTSEYFKNFRAEDMSVGLDFHSDNVLVLDGELLFFDVLLVNERWRLIDPAFDVCRLATDVEVFGSPELTSAVTESLQCPPEMIDAYMLYAALIKGAYYAIMGNDELSLKFLPIVRRLSAILEQRLSKHL